MLGEALERLLKETAGGGAVVASAWWLGRAVLARRAALLTRIELEIFSFGLGAAVLSQIIFLLGLLHLYYDAVFVALGAGCLAVWLRWGRGAQVMTEAAAPEEAFWKKTAATVAAVYIPLYLLNALAPDWGPDSLGYHLGLVFRYYREHALVPAIGNIYGLFPQGAEMLYLFAFALGRHNAPQLVHFAMFSATLPMLVALGRRIGSPGAGWIAALLYGLSPVVGVDAVLAYNDCALAFFGLLAFYALWLYRERPSPHLAALAGVLAGFCFAVKMTGGLFVLAGGAALVAMNRRRLQPVFLYATAAALLMGPWVGRNWALAGNPVAPFYNSTFPNAYATVIWEERFRDFVRDYTPREETGESGGLGSNLAGVLWEGERLGGIIGPVFLAAPLALLAWRSPAFWPLATAFAVAAAAWFSNAGARFLIPSLVFGSLLLGLALDTRKRRWVGFALVVFHAVSVYPAVAERWLASPHVFRIREWPWRVVVGQEAWDVFVQRYNAALTGARGLAKSAPPGSRALAFDMPADAYFPGEILDSRFSRVGFDALTDLLAATDPNRAPTLVRRFVWDEPIAVERIHVRQTAASQDEWEIAEIRSIPPVELEVEVDRFPWTVDRLTDGSTYSVWRSGERLSPAQLTVRPAAAIRALEIVAPAMQSGATYTTDPPTRTETDRLDPAPADLRAAAHRSLIDKGIGYLMGEVGAGGHSVALDPIDQDPAAWGLKEVWREDDWRVFRVMPEGPRAKPSQPLSHPIQ